MIDELKLSIFQEVDKAFILHSIIKTHDLLRSLSAFIKRLASFSIFSAKDILNFFLRSSLSYLEILWQKAARKNKAMFVCHFSFSLIFCSILIGYQVVIMLQIAD